MKTKEILEKTKIDENDCSVCAVYNEAEKLIDDRDAISCASCGSFLAVKDQFDYSTVLDKDDVTLVGESNCVDPEEKYRKCYVRRCAMCNDHTAFVPTKIIYNANHDIYYTGGNKYLSISKEDLLEEAEKKILPKIENYTKRIRDGESALAPWNLMLWIKYEIEEICAKVLYDQGVKI